MLVEVEDEILAEITSMIEDDCGMPPEQLGNLINKFVFEGMGAISE